MELLAPAGNLEKLKTAFLYGADAVYLGGQKYGLRAASDNFSFSQMRMALEIAKTNSKKVYVVLNSFFHEEDFKGLAKYLLFLDEIGVDALIVSDIGVVSYVRQNSSIPVHLSTQASALNVNAVKLWKKLGVERIVLGREVTIQEAETIKEKTGIELEMFIHGSMCMAYSGNCNISNYTQGRDSNRGGCAHSCRFEYSIYEDKNSNALAKTTFMSSKDLTAVDHIEKLFRAKIESLKIEGRMKSTYYVGSVCRIYRVLIDELKMNGKISNETRDFAKTEFDKISNRDYTDASLFHAANADSISNKRDESNTLAQTVGVVLGHDKGKGLLIEVRSKINNGESVQIMDKSKEGLYLDHCQLFDYLGNEIQTANPGSTVFFKTDRRFDPQSLVRKTIV